MRHVLEALAAHIAADRLDVVILNDAPPTLAFQVLKHGKLAFERDPTALHRLQQPSCSLTASPCGMATIGRL